MLPFSSSATTTPADLLLPTSIVQDPGNFANSQTPNSPTHRKTSSHDKPPDQNRNPNPKSSTQLHIDRSIIGQSVTPVQRVAQVQPRARTPYQLNPELMATSRCMFARRRSQAWLLLGQQFGGSGTPIPSLLLAAGRS